MTPNEQIQPRCPERCMYPSELVSLLRKHKHPRFFSVHIETNRWGDRQRKAVGLSPHGTIYLATPYEREESYTVLCDCIPYASQREVEFDEKTGRFKEGHRLIRGWRNLLSSMARAGLLYPDAELDYLLGERTWVTVPKEHRL